MQSWQIYFENQAGTYTSPPGISSVRSVVRGASSSVGTDSIQSMNLVRLIRGYQEQGHEVARIDPLNLMNRTVPDSIKLETHGFSEADLDKEFVLPTQSLELFADGGDKATLREIVSRLETAYCQSIGYEYMHIQEADRCDWLRERIEGKPATFSQEKRKELAKGLVKGHGFEEFLEKKFGTEKRFGVDGCESLIAGMNRMIDRASEKGVNRTDDRI